MTKWAIQSHQVARITPINEDLLLLSIPPSFITLIYKKMKAYGNCRNPTLGLRVRMQLTPPKSGKMESSGTPKNLEDDLRGQISLPWRVLYINGKLLKRRCPKWPRISHLNICSPSYGQKKGRESNCQFDSRPLKVGNRPLPDVSSRSATRRWKALNERYNFDLELVPIRVRGKEL